MLTPLFSNVPLLHLPDSTEALNHFEVFHFHLVLSNVAACSLFFVNSVLLKRIRSRVQVMSSTLVYRCLLEIPMKRHLELLFTGGFNGNICILSSELRSERGPNRFGRSNLQVIICFDSVKRAIEHVRLRRVGRGYG